MENEVAMTKSTVLDCKSSRYFSVLESSIEVSGQTGQPV